MFFMLFLLDDRRIRIQETKKHTDADSQHCFLTSSAAGVPYLNKNMKKICIRPIEAIIPLKTKLFYVLVC
jgi:hypothetical protein